MTECRLTYEAASTSSVYESVSVAAENVVGVGAARTCTAQPISEFVDNQYSVIFFHLFVYCFIIIGKLVDRKESVSMNDYQRLVYNCVPQFPVDTAGRYIHPPDAGSDVHTSPAGGRPFSSPFHPAIYGLLALQWHFVCVSVL